MVYGTELIYHMTDQLGTFDNITKSVHKEMLLASSI